MKKISTLYALVALVFLLVSFDSSAQSVSANHSSGLMYIATEDITVEKFQALQNTLKTNSSFSVKEACVPAHIISVRVHSGTPNDQSFAEFKTILSSVDIKTVSLKPDYNDEKFLQKCSSARTAN